MKMMSAASSSEDSSSSACGSVPEEVLEQVVGFLTSERDRSAFSLVCKAWYRADAGSRRSVRVGNCYACRPETVTGRFTALRSLTLKGKPRFSDFNLVPDNWGAHVYPWLLHLSSSSSSSPPLLQDLRLKRMTISDNCLLLLSLRFPFFRSLVLTFCDGFSSHGLASLVSNCRHLQELDLQECSIMGDSTAEWLSAFPDSSTSLTSLNLANLNDDVDFHDLERIVARCSRLRKLKLNRSISLDQLRRLLLLRGPDLEELGTGSFVQDADGYKLASLFENCRNITSLSGLWEVAPHCLPLLYPICGNLRTLNLNYSPIGCLEFTSLISQCHSLECLWVQDLVEDRGLEAVAVTCRNLRELRVMPSSDSSRSLVTEKGLVAISRHCRELRYILFFCNQMTNSALQEFGKNCPKITHFRLCIMKLREPDYVTKQPMDEGFGAIVKSCPGIRRLSVSGLLTDRAFELIGKYAKNMRSLSLAFAGDSGIAMEHLMRGCTNLKKLEIRDCPFGDVGLFSGAGRYYEMRSLWMSACGVSAGACESLARQMPLLNVEMIVEDDKCLPSRKQISSHSKDKVEKLYLYRTLAGRRSDCPPCVYTF